MFCSSKGAFLAVLLPVIHLSPICVALRCGGRGPFYNVLIKTQILNGPVPHGCDFHKWLSSGIAFVPLLPSPSPAYMVPSVFPWSPVPCWLGCWISPPPSGETGKLEVTAGRTFFPPAGIRFESCALTKSFPRERRPWLWKRLWACFTMVLLPLPLPKRGGSFLDPHGEKPVEFLEGKAHQHSVTSKTVAPRNFLFSYYFTLSLQQFISLWVQWFLLHVNRSRLLYLWTHLSLQIWGGSLPCNFRSLINPRKVIHFKFTQLLLF